MKFSKLLNELAQFRQFVSRRDFVREVEEQVDRVQERQGWQDKDWNVEVKVEENEDVSRFYSVARPG